MRARPAWFLFAAPGLALLLLAGALLRRPPTPAATPDLGFLLPQDLSGWRVVEDPSILKYRAILQADALAQRHYVQGDTHISLYAAYWAPGHSNPGKIALHTPEICWPGGGWSLVTDGTSQANQAPKGLVDYRCFRSPSGAKEYVYYWLLQGGQPVQLLNPYRFSELFRLWFSGENRPNDTQLFVRVSSNRPWNEIAASQPLVRLKAPVAQP